MRSVPAFAVSTLAAFAAATAAPASAQSFQAIDHPSAGPGGSTVFTGLSNGRIVGSWSNAAGTAGGAFIYSNGAFTPLAHPNAASTSPFGIAGNYVTGYFTAASGDARTRSFLVDGATWTDFDYPASPAPETYALGVGSDGTVVGFYDTGGAAHGFLVTPARWRLICSRPAAA